MTVRKVGFVERYLKKTIYLCTILCTYIQKKTVRVNEFIEGRIARA